MNRTLISFALLLASISFALGAPHVYSYVYNGKNYVWDLSSLLLTTDTYMLDGSGNQACGNKGNIRNVLLCDTVGTTHTSAGGLGTVQSATDTSIVVAFSSNLNGCTSGGQLVVTFTYSATATASSFTAPTFAGTTKAGKCAGSLSVTTKVGPKTCTPQTTFYDATHKQTWDLSVLPEFDFTGIYDVTPGFNYNFRINLGAAGVACDGVDNSVACQVLSSTADPAAVSATTYNLGLVCDAANTYPVATFPDAQTLSLTYQFGDSKSCASPDFGATQRNVQFNIICDSSVTDPTATFVAESPVCHYVFDIRTPNCPGAKAWADPHFLGFDGAEYTVAGESENWYTLITDTDTQVNAYFNDLHDVGGGNTKYGVFMQNITVMVYSASEGKAHTLEISALTTDWLVDGVETPAQPFLMVGSAFEVAAKHGWVVVSSAAYEFWFTTFYTKHIGNYLNVLRAHVVDSTRSPAGLMGDTYGKAPATGVQDKDADPFADGELSGSASDYEVSGPYFSDSNNNKYAH